MGLLFMIFIQGVSRSIVSLGLIIRKDEEKEHPNEKKWGQRTKGRGGKSLRQPERKIQKGRPKCTYKQLARP